MGRTILQRMAEGDRQAAQDCIEQYGNLVWSLARRYLGSGADAEDVVQETFVDLWKSAGRYRPEQSSEPAFVAMIARRRMIDRLRAADRRPPTTPLDETMDAAGDQLERMEHSAEASLAVRALGALNPEQRQVILLSVVQGMSHAEVAEATGLPLGTVKSSIRRGLATVRDRLRERGAGEGVST